jgi:D-threonine aldolase
MWAMRIHDLPTPSLIVDAEAFTHNLATMSAAWPGRTLRPHVKAFKSTDLARELVGAGHDAFCGATTKEMLGMAKAGLGQDLLLANELIDPIQLRQIASCGVDVTVAVDSTATVEAAAAAGLQTVLIDVDVGCFRCGCAPQDAGALAERARELGLVVRGVMGYEGHLMMEPATTKRERVHDAMTTLLEAHQSVGGDVVSGGGTGTWAVNQAVTELQAGSFTLMDSAYGQSDLPFRQALFLWLTVISVNPGGWAVANGGLKCLGMDHGPPTVEGWNLLYCSDEHLTIVTDQGGALPVVGSRIRVVPAHVDPTVAYHERMYVVDGEDVIDTWSIDLRNW